MADTGEGIDAYKVVWREDKRKLLSHVAAYRSNAVRVGHRIEQKFICHTNFSTGIRPSVGNFCPFGSSLQLLHSYLL